MALHFRVKDGLQYSDIAQFIVESLEKHGNLSTHLTQGLAFDILCKLVKSDGRQQELLEMMTKNKEQWLNTVKEFGVYTKQDELRIMNEEDSEDESEDESEDPS
jgi:hypothetical protein